MDQFNEVTLNQYRRKVSPNSRRGLFVCPNSCSRNHYNLLLRNPILPECLSISCSVCEQKWYVCINCRSQLKHITNHLQYKRHANICRENYVFPAQQHKSQNQNLIKTIEQLADYAKNPQPTTVLVFNYKYKTLDKRKALYKSLSKSAVVFDSKKIYEDKVPAWIQNYLQSKQITITPKAALMLSEFLGNDLSKIANELNKLEIVVGADKQVTPEIIEENIGISKDFNNFELQKAIGNLDHKKAYQIVNYFAQNQKQHPFVLTISILYMYFTKLMTLHTVRDKNPTSVSKALGVNPYFVNDYIAVSKNFPMKRISGVLETLRIYDAKSKGVGANLSPKDLYNELIYNILK